MQVQMPVAACSLAQTCVADMMPFPCSEKLVRLGTGSFCCANAESPHQKPKVASSLGISLRGDTWFRACRDWATPYEKTYLQGVMQTSQRCSN